MSDQLTFDIDAMLAEANPEPPRPTYLGRAPLHFTVEAFTIEEFAEAWGEYIARFGNFDCIRRSHMWHPNFLTASTATPRHSMQVLGASLGEQFASVERTICGCGWASAIVTTESLAVELWHDHAWPGWRDLPVVPSDARPQGGGYATASRSAVAWVQEHYPTGWCRPGAPVLTDRDGVGTRHVPGYSPWGGYDISATALEVGERAA